MRGRTVTAQGGLSVNDAIEKRRKDEWRRDVSHPNLGTASLWGMSKTPTARSQRGTRFRDPLDSQLADRTG